MNNMRRKSCGVVSTGLAGAFACGLALSPLGAGAEPRLWGETSNPLCSFFFDGRPASMTVKATGFAPGAEHPLVIDIRDYKDDPYRRSETTFKADGTGAWTGSFDLPTERFGCYRVHVTSGKVGLAKRGSCPAGILTYGVVRDPRTRPLYTFDEAFFGTYGWASWFGMRHVFNGQHPTADAEQGRKNVERLNAAEWKTYGTIEIAQMLRPEVYSWGRDFWTKEGLAWMYEAIKDPARSGGRYQRLFTEGEEHVRAALEKLVRMAKEQTPKGQDKRIYEILSEVDLQVPDPKVAVKIARVLKETLDKYDPEGVTCYPGVSNVRDVNYQQQLIDLGLLDYLNAYSIHPYTANPPEPNGFLVNLRTMRQMIRSKLGRDLPFYSTEQGFATQGTPEGEVAKLNGQLRVNLMLLGEGCEKSYLFYRGDFGNDDDRDRNGDYGLMFNLELGAPGKRWNSEHWSPRAAACGFAALSWLLDGKRPTACLEGAFGETTLGYAYADKNDECFIALWDFGGTCEAKLPVGKERIRVADVMGNETEVDAPGGVLTLKLGPTPSYVIAPDPKLWGRKGNMAAEITAQARRLAAEREARVKLAIGGVDPSFSGEEPAVAVKVENRTEAEQDVKITLSLEGDAVAARTATCRVPAKSSKSVALALAGFAPDPVRVFALKTSVEIPGVFRADREDEINFWRAERVDDFGGWKPARHFDIGRRLSNARFPVPEPQDLSAAFAFGWNERGLAGDVLVTDDVHVNNSKGFDIWRGDALQMGFARQVLDKTTENFQTDIKLQAASECNFALTPRGVEVYRSNTFDPVRYPASRDGAGRIDPAEFKATVVREGNVTHYRFFVPWAYLNFKESEKVEAGMNVRVAAFVNDQDVLKGAPMPPNMVLFDLKHELPKKFGRVVLCN